MQRLDGDTAPAATFPDGMTFRDYSAGARCAFF